MNIANRKKQNNIAEYIIHMYQTEDLIRAFEFDIEKIKEFVIKNIPENEDSKADLAAWYEAQLNAIKSQGIEKSGHLKELNEIVAELNSLKDKLIKTDETFNKTYQSAKPFIDKSIGLSKGQITDEIQICLNGIYGLLLLRMNGQHVPNELMESLNHFGDVLSYLSYKYKQGQFLQDN
ncbi:MAG TPA: DUF4924 family protein [Fulvivirga sp.]|nr:DUF4924 family protein [Fulvivirga sp.]